jgi:hypothetical protein
VCNITPDKVESDWNTRPIEDSLRQTISTLRSELEAMTGAVVVIWISGYIGMDNVFHADKESADEAITLARAIRKREGWDE